MCSKCPSASRTHVVDVHATHQQHVQYRATESSSLAVNASFQFVDIRYYKKIKLMLTGRAKAYSSSCSQTISLSPAISSPLLREYRSLMSSCAGFLEPRKSRLGPLKSTFNAENFIRSLLSILIGFGAICSCNVSRSPKSPKNP